MTIDERLDRLTARHESLTQAVELMILQQRDWNEKHEIAQQKNEVLLAHALESIDQLARVAFSHDQRIET